MSRDSSHPGTVLHLEDDLPVAAAVRTLLEAHGYRVLTACSAAEAATLVRGQGASPDALIVDYHLPEEATGTDVAEQIARVLGHPVPTIIWTGDLANAEVPWLPGAPILLASKPIDAEVLVDTLAHFVALNRAAQVRDAATRRVALSRSSASRVG